MLRGRKAFYFYFCKTFSFKFWVLGELESVDFEWFSPRIHREVEPETVSNFPHFLNSLTVMSQVLFPTIIRQFSRPLCDYEG